LVALIGAPVASAYYHFLYYNNRSGPFTPIPLRFDLGAIPTRTVPYFISDQGPSPMAAGDTFTAWQSQIRLAADVWNRVDTSDLRLRFGGLSTGAQAPQAGPGIDVVFEDLPPAVLAQGGPITVAEVQYLSNGAAFVPILRSKLQLARDLSQYPSWGEAYFVTLVHEFGHTLGLQHTLVSSVMSTSITRGTSKAKPLGADDIAGISVLYPSKLFSSITGSISGRVTLSGAGVNVASVVAINNAGVAVSALTNPDGSYRMEGVPPGDYWIYVHPLPPPFSGEVTPANIVLPKDPQQNFFDPGPSFDTQFYPATRDFSRAQTVRVRVGTEATAINFGVTRRTSPAVYAVQTYAFTGQVPVKGPSLRSGTRATLIFTGVGLMNANGTPVSGLSASIIGDGVSVVAGSLRNYSTNPPYLQMQLDVAASASSGPRAILFSVPSDISVLPMAFHVANSAAPSISGLTQFNDENGVRALSVSGTGLDADTRVIFDGVETPVTRVNSDGSLTVPVPAAPSNYRAAVSVLNPDGQSSAQALGSALPAFLQYDTYDTPSFSVSPAALPAGSDAMLEITGFNTNFQNGLMMVGFGSSDVTVRRIWVLSTNRLLVNVSVSPYATPGTTAMSLVTGLHVLQQRDFFRVLPGVPNLLNMSASVTNAATSLEGVPSGGTAQVALTGFGGSTAGWILTVSNQNAAILSVNFNVMTFQVPAGLPVGPAIVRLTTPGGEAFPIVMNIDSAAPMISQARFDTGTAVETTNPARPGDLIALTVYGLGDVQPAGVRVNVGGTDHPVISIAAGPQPGSTIVTFRFVSSLLGGNVVPVTLAVDTRVSAPYNLPVRFGLANSD
jgi:hypothetical protein